jgi:hypothetical protein
VTGFPNLMGYRSLQKAYPLRHAVARTGIERNLLSKADNASRIPVWQEICNTDQGVQFTSAAFVDELASRGVRISMDGRGRYLDNIFIERLWRSLKYEDVYIKAYGSIAEARRSLAEWLAFYNDVRPHQSLGYRTPREILRPSPVSMWTTLPHRCATLRRCPHTHRHINRKRK